MSTEPGFPQHLNWRRVVAKGVIQLADGAWLTAKAYKGPDQEYASYLEMEHVAEQINADLAKLSGGWCVQAEVIRSALTLTADPCYSDSPTAQLLHQERAAEYAKPNAHFGNRLVLVFTWLPPKEIGQMFSTFFFGKRRVGSKPSRKVLLELFQEQVKAICAGLGTNLKFQDLNDKELKRFLWCCVTGQDREIGADHKRLQYALGAVPVYPHQGLIGGLHTRAIGIYGYPDGDTPQMLEELTNLPFAMRISQRFAYSGQRTAIEQLKRIRRIWMYGNRYNARGLLWRQVKKSEDVDDDTVERNDDADEQVQSVRRAIKKLQEGKEKGGQYTFVVILRDQSEERVEEQANVVVQLLSRLGFSPIVEDYNFPPAFKGSLPGHGSTNKRRTPLTTRDIARLFTWSSQWHGHARHPSPLYPPNSAPLLICKSTGNTPFALSPRLHFLVIGPTGAGKTFLLNTMATAHLQYPGGQVFLFDRDAGGIVPTLACGGNFFDLDAERYAPLAHIDQEHEYAWAFGFCKQLAALQGYTMTPEVGVDLQRALQDLSHAAIHDRTVTGLLGQLQTSDSRLPDALSYYAGSNPGGVLDGKYTAAVESPIVTFDMEQIFKRPADVHTPVLGAQIHALEQRMTDGRPSLLLFDEGWSAASNELLTSWIEEGSATMRKKVVSIGLVLHSPGDLSVFPHKDRLLANVGTYIFLPNEMADTAGMRPHYAALGLGNREIKLLSELRPRRDYYVVEGNQRRQFQLSVGPWHQALLGVNGRDCRARVLELRKTYGSEWFSVWLKEQGHEELATTWRNQNNRKEAA